MQELIVTEDQINQFIGQYLWPMVRVTAFFLAVPVIGARTVPARIRLIFALMVTSLIIPLLPNAPVVAFLSLQGMILLVKETLIGLALGFVMQVVLHVFVLTGQFIALKLGLGFAAQNDPSSGVSVASISQFYLLLSTLLFLAVDGHLVVIQLLISSYDTFPVGGAGMGPAHFAMIAHLGTWMFSAALLVSLPLLTSMMIVNLSFGVMGRSAPQMNILNVGFPITLMFGFILMWYSLANFLPLFNQILDEGFSAAKMLLEAK